MIQKLRALTITIAHLMVQRRNGKRDTKKILRMAECINLPRLFLRRKLQFFYDVFSRDSTDLTRETVAACPKVFLTIVGQENWHRAIECCENNRDEEWSALMEERLALLTPTFTRKDRGKGEGAEESTAPQTGVNETVTAVVADS